MEPEQRNNLNGSARRSLEASESSPIVNDADDQDIELEALGRRHESTLTLDELPPPLGVKLTGYRLLNMSVVFTFGMAKAILTYMGRSAMPTTLDWIGGALLAVILYWIGLYEPECSEKWEWFFQVDLTRAICYFVLRFMGGVLGVFFAIRGSLAITSLSSVPVFLFASFLPGVSRDLWLGIFVMFTICVHLTWLRMRRRLRRGARIRQGVMGFLDDYGLSASLPEKYEWSGTVGITLGFYCGTALVCSPLAFVYLSL